MQVHGAALPLHMNPLLNINLMHHQLMQVRVGTCHTATTVTCDVSRY